MFIVIGAIFLTNKIWTTWLIILISEQWTTWLVKKIPIFK
jgi:hypothetical protein